MFLLFVSIAGYSEEVSRERIKTSNGENLTVVTYRNEPNGLIRREWYGVEPIFSKVIEYFDSSNSDFIDRIEYFEVKKNEITDEPNLANMSKVYYLINHPERIRLREQQSDSNYHYYKFLFYSDDTSSRIEQIFIKNHSMENVMVVTLYSEVPTNNINIKKQIDYYNVNSFLYLTINEYYQNPEGLINVGYNYVYPYFTSTTLPFRELRNYENNPSGLIEVKIENSMDNSTFREEVYNTSVSRFGVSTIRSYSVNNKKVKEVFYYDERPINGTIYRVERFFNDNGSVRSAHFYNNEDVLLDEKYY